MNTPVSILPYLKSYACRFRATHLPWPQGWICNKKIEDQELFLEIGFGSGDHLLHQAQTFPHRRYVGIEVYIPGIVSLYQKMNQTSTHSITVIQSDARKALLEFIPEKSCKEIYLLFPDPWPKRKHQKRRIVSHYFLDLLSKVMQPHGVFYFSTDDASYAEKVLQTMQQRSDWINLGHPYIARPPRPMTAFESRGIRLGHRIIDLCFQRVD